MNSAQVDFQQVRIKHILFKSKVRSVLYGGVLDTAFFSEAGPINQWFSKVGRVKYAQEPELFSLHKTHNELMANAQRLFSLYRSGSIDQAHQGMKDIEKLSDKFQGLLTQIEKRLSVRADVY
ncbi:histidine kinase [Pontibacter sp. JH31]|uniref:Histidine kinase n=1 Tax=Pontibacter aquaedesilientis TaxID=2766980 RepID=A0ABR7XC07_9BACT|nr:histidine kinase [Pontibacter aquaedesilientis]MBD1395834.1 histidine kinase [Pontibacter aquaedesilientis]